MNRPEALSKITAAILAGGLGSRLKSVVADRPKALAEINGRPFLAYLLDQLSGAGIRRVVLCTGYLADQVKQEVGHERGPLSILYSEEKTPLGTAGALKNAEEFFESDSVLVMNGDSYCDADISAFRDWHDGRNSYGSLLLMKAFGANRYGFVHSDHDDVIIEFNEKKESTEEGWINAGIYLLRADLIKAVPENRAVSLEREMFPLWASKRILHGYQHHGNFIDIGIPADYEKAKGFFEK